MTPDEFRGLFPALGETVWLDTPGAPPGATPVVAALREALARWLDGEFDWQDWDGATDEARRLFAGFLRVEPATVAAVGSLAEAVATVARSLPPGPVVVAAEDFRSGLFPWLARGDVVAVPPRDGVTRVEDLIAALTEDTVALAVSEVTSRDGQRLDLKALRAATDEVGARLLVNVTQSLGVLRFDPAVRPDYLAVHGYKWLLCPRGAAWLVTRPDRLGELVPLAPNWKSTERPIGYFGGPMRLATDATRLDASPAWFSWVGACAALRLFHGLDPAAVEAHCLRLANEFAGGGARSHIVVLRTADGPALARRLRANGIRASAHAHGLRFGFHYFNNDADVLAALRVLHA